MRLGINGWRLMGRRTGVGRYLLNLISHWSPEMSGGLFEKLTLYLPGPSSRADFSLRSGVEEQVLSSRLPMLLWENTHLANRSRDHVLFQPSYTIPLFRRGKTVVVVHDAVHELYPHLFPRSVRLFYTPLYRWSARKADLVITDSRAGREDITRSMGVEASKIRVVYLAPDDSFRASPTPDDARRMRDQLLGSQVPFFLFVGKLSGRRSIDLLLNGFAEFKRKSQQPHKLVVIGLNIHQLDVDRKIKSLGLVEEIVYPGFISDEALNGLYHSCTALISPSIYETVCLPVMEAQAAGTAVICTRTAGMEEITGGHAQFLAVPEVSHMAKAIMELALKPDKQRELAHRGREFSCQFSWVRCARETLEILGEVGLSP